MKLMAILMKSLLELSRSAFYPIEKISDRKPVTSLRQLMDRVDKYKMIEDNQQQGKGKAEVVP